MSQKRVEKNFIDRAAINSAISEGAASTTAEVRAVIEKGRARKGLSIEEVSLLCTVTDPALHREICRAAQEAKEAIYGKRVVMFAPLYISNLCRNECTYCAFRVKNKGIARRALNFDEIEAETRALLKEGHKRVLLVAGESYPKEGFSYVLDAVDAVYRAREGEANIRRVNVNVAPLSVDEFAALKKRAIGTYQLFQETYDEEVYRRVHLAGQKADYQWRLSAIDRAMEAGIDDVGIGVLFGLADWKFELLALMHHVRHLEERFGVGPHTISVPRLEPASGSDVAANPPNPVDDETFARIVAILRLAVPYTGIILSTRETPQMRRSALSLGVSQISAGSRTNPGGYGESHEQNTAQFSLGDHRSLDEVIRDVASMGYVPSFCTGCYRLGRTGADFMDLAKPGDIKRHCTPNGLSSFQEYLDEYASEETRKVGRACISAQLEQLPVEIRQRAEKLLAGVAQGKRDVYC